MLGAAIIAVTTGFGVYQSCTRFADIRRYALTIDAIGAVALVLWFYYCGVWA